MPKLTTGARGDRKVFGHAPISPASPAADPRRLVMLQRRQRLAHRLRPELVSDRLQGLNARRQEIAVFVDDLFKLAEEEFCLLVT